MSQKNLTIKQWVDIFNTVNNDCIRQGESVYPLTDVEYYSEQIHNLMDEEDWNKAVSIAQRIREYVECTGLGE